MTSIPLERAYSLQAAEKALTEELDKLNYDFEFQTAGEFVSTSKCLIKNKETGNVLAAGNGKGEPTASRVGSLFEATEHLFSHYEQINLSKITYLRIADFCQGNEMCNTLPLALLKGSGNAIMPFLTHSAVSREQTCLYPLALACPSYIDFLFENAETTNRDTFNYNRLEQYSSNSGTAIGMTGEEAIIHGLLESIERTSLSQLLANTFLLNKKHHLKIIDSRSLTEDISELYNRIEKESGNRILVFEMPNKFGIPAYCSWMEQDQFELAYIGFGCSLSADHAILRSLYELAQYFLLSKHIHGYDKLLNLNKQVLAQLEGLPLHQNCAKFNLARKCKELGYQTIHYKDIAKRSFNTNPKEYLAQLSDIIYAHEEIPFVSELNTIGNNITITHTFITGEDRFFNVRNGKSVFPVSLEVI